MKDKTIECDRIEKLAKEFQKSKPIMLFCANFCIFFLGVFFPLSVSLKGFFLFTSVFFALFDLQIREKISSSLKHRWVQTSILMSFLLFIGIFYSEAEYKRAFEIFLKYSHIILTIVLIPIFSKKKYSSKFFYGLTIGIFFLCLIQINNHTNVFNFRSISLPNPIYVSFIASLTACVCFYVYFTQRKIVFAIASIFGFIFALNLSTQTTGLIVIGIFTTFLILFEKILIRQISFVKKIFICAFLIACVFLNKDLLKLSVDKIMTVVKEADKNLIKTEETISQSSQNFAKHKHESSLLRLKFINQGIQLFKFAENKQRFFGYGTGSWPILIQKNDFSYFDHDKKQVPNPHNEFLHILIQLGIFGIFILCFWIISPFFDLKNSNYPQKQLMSFLVLSFIAICFIDSILFLSLTKDFYICLISFVLGNENFSNNK